MPHSLVLNLFPKTSIPANHLGGRHLHALFLELVRSLNPELATELHQQTTEKAFALSPLQVERNPRHNQQRYLNSVQWEHKKPIQPGTPCWWRISLLDEALFGSLTHLWLGLNPNRPWHLGPAELHVSRVFGTPQDEQPWANFATYSQIYEQALDGTQGNAQDARKLQFQFCTPTTFHHGRYDYALPAPAMVFKSLLRRWNRYSSVQFPEEIVEHLYPSFFDIQTEITIGNRSKFIGCVGTVVYQILGEVEPETIKQINALANYAMYAGVGRKTPMGMGMVRRIMSSSKHS